MRLRRPIFLPTLLALIPTVAPADERPLRATRSENGRFELRIDPGRDGRTPCTAELLDRRPERGQGRERWSGRLVNAVAPAQAFIRDDAQFVVTLDEFRFGGSRCAVAVYDHAGAHRRTFELRELLSGGDWREVRSEGRSIDWLSGAQCEFAEERPQFVIRLRWGRVVRIDLERLALDVEPGEIDAAAEGDDAAIPPELLALLGAAEAAQAQSDEMLLAEAQQLLETLLAERAAEEAGPPPEWVEALARAGIGKMLEEAIPQMLSESIDAALDKAIMADMQRQLEEAAAAGDAEAAEELARLKAAAAAAASFGEKSAGNSAAVGAPVPQPDPRQPVNYVEWLKRATSVDGPSAVPHIEAALAARQDFVGDADLKDRALRGDPAALAAPEIQAWLTVNRPAWEALRSGLDQPYRGMPIASDDGTLISILLPHAAPVRDLGRVGVALGNQALADGRPADALGAYADVMRAGAQQRQGPTLIENLVGIAMQNMAAESTLDAYAAAGDAIDFGAAAEQLAAAYREAPPMTHTLQTERAFILDVVQRLYAYDEASGRYQVSADGVSEFRALTQGVGAETAPLEALGMGVALGAIGFEGMTRQANAHYDAMTEAFAAPYSQGSAALQELEQRVDNPAYRAGNPVLSTLLPALSRAYQNGTQAEANRRATLLVTQIKAHQQRTGQYPASLAEVGGSGLIDPYTGQPFAYRAQDGDFSLYSLGANGVDDGGQHERSGRERDVRYWPRPPRP